MRAAALPQVLRKPGACACGGCCPRCQNKSPIQTKLAVSEPGDVYEQEADRVAEQVMRMPAPNATNAAEGWKRTASLGSPPPAGTLFRAPYAPQSPSSGDEADAQGAAPQPYGERRGALWEDATIVRHNAAERIFEEHDALLGGGGGLSTPVVNDVALGENTGALDLAQAIHEPPIAQSRSGAATNCWYANGLFIAGHTVMDIYSQPPWSYAANRSEVAEKFSFDERCAGAAESAEIVARGEPSDEKLEEFIRLGEEEHHADHKKLFIAILAPYAERVNAHVGNTPATRIRGANITDCAGKLRTDDHYMKVANDFVLAGNRLTEARHQNDRHSIILRGTWIENGCTRIVYDVKSHAL